MAEAELASFIDRYTAEYVRTYPHPVERVWRAITDPAEIGQWFIRPTKWELTEGGAYRMHDDDFAGTIVLLEPPRLIRFTDTNVNGPEAWFQYELTAVDGGTRLRFLHHSTPGHARAGQRSLAWDTPWFGGLLGGWHSAFEELADLLDGVPCGSRRPSTPFSAMAEDWATRPSAVPLTSEQKAQIVRELRERERWMELIAVYDAHVDATLPPAAAQPEGV